jgi:hypothetical protein
MNYLMVISKGVDLRFDELSVVGGGLLLSREIDQGLRPPALAS